MRHIPFSGPPYWRRELSFSCTTLGRAGLSGSILTLRWLGLCQHISQWSLSWQKMADPWLQISVMHLLKTQCSIEVGWVADRLHSTHLGCKMGIAGWVSARSKSSLKTFTVTFMCAEVVPALCHSIPPPPGPPLHPSTTNLLSVTVSQ